MAIAPIEQRLNSILPETTATPSVNDLQPDQAPTITKEDLENTPPITYEPGTPDMEVEGTQVAGVFSKGSSMIRDIIAKQAPKGERTIVPDAARQAKDELPVVGDVGGVKAIPAASEELTEKVRVATQKRVTEGKVSGLPPEEAFNLSRYQTEDAAAIVGGVSDALGIKTTKVTFDEIKSKASELGVDEKFLARLTDDSGNMMPNAVDTYRALQVLESSAGELDRLFKTVADGTASESQKLQLRQQIAFHGLVQRGVKGIQTETARALAVFRIPRDASVDTIRNVLDEYGGENSLVDMANKYMTLNTRAAKNNMVEKSMMSGVKDVWLTTWMNGLLSLPTTHFKNVVGTNFFGLYQIPERAVGGFFSMMPDRFREGIKAEGSRFSKSYWERIPGSAEDKIALDEFMTQAMSLRHGTVNALSMAADAWKRNAPSDPLTKVEIQRGNELPAISSAAFGVNEDTWLAKAIDLYGTAITVPGRALMTEDEFAKSWMYNMELKALVDRDAKSMYRSLIDSGVDETSAIKQVEDFAIDALKNPSAELDAQALNFAQRGTFTAKLPPALNKIQETFNNFEVMGFPALKVLVPFFKTPANIGMEVIERTPFAPLSSRWRQDMAAGGPQRDMAMSKVALGSTVMYTFGSFAADGSITGRGPSRKSEREALERTGWKPYSIKVGDNYYSYAGLDPMSGMLAIAADYAEYAKYEPDADKIEEVFLGGTFALYHYMSEQPYLQGISDLAKVIGSGDEQGAKQALQTIGKQYGSFVIGGSPMGAYGSLVAGIERTIDPTKKDVKADPELPMGVRGFVEGFNRYQARLPYFNQSLPDDLNMWGEERTDGSGKVYEMFLPTRVSPEQFSEVDDVLVSLGSPLSIRSFDKIDGVELTAEERNEFKRTYGKEIFSGGMNVKDAIVARAYDPAFAQLTLDKQQGVVKKVHEDYIDAAKMVMLQKSPDLVMRIEKLKSNREAFGLYYKEK